MRSVDADHHYGGQRGELDRDPHQPDIVGDERQVHREHHDLIHRVIKAQIARRQPPDPELVADIPALKMLVVKPTKLPSTMKTMLRSSMMR